jgi:AraC-like DNA-binding protein
MQNDEKLPAALPTTGGLATWLAYERIAQAGLDVEPLLKKARLTVRQIEDRDARLSVHSQIRFLDLAADLLMDPFLGFHLGRTFDLREIGLLYYTFASADVFGDALERAARFSTTANEGISLRYFQDDDAVVAINYVGVTRFSDRHQIEAWVAALVRSCRELTGRHVVPRQVKMTHHRHEDCSELNAFFGTSVAFGADEDAVVFPGTVKDLPVVSADPYLHDLLVGYCEQALAQRPSSSGSLRAAVENAIAPLLPHGKAHVDEVARRLGMSERTLARHLASEGLTFNAVLSELRSDLARFHVRNSRLPVSHIAWLLGFREASAFTHAFKRWTGKTPRQMRAQGAVIAR